MLFKYEVNRKEFQMTHMIINDLVNRVDPRKKVSTEVSTDICTAPVKPVEQVYSPALDHAIGNAIDGSKGRRVQVMC